MTETQDQQNGAHHIIEPSEATGEFVESAELLHGDAGDISAARVTLEQSTAKSVTGEQVTLRQSAVKSISTETATMTQSAALVLNSADTAVHESTAGLISGERVDVFDSVIGVVNGPINVTEGSARVFIQIGPSDPSVKPVLDAQSALGLGAGFAASLLVLSRLLRRLLGN
jgi:hypothetical protein